jgi:DNA-directed RNA polymerase specialized sigma24 family protein
MSPSRARVGVSADAFVAVVRAYADRVHDDVRRLGCSASAAAEVVETSALGLAERLRTRPHEVRDLVGAWFRDARVYADRVAGGDETEPEPEALAAGAGIVQRSEDDAATREALARLGERDRIALLLRDAYDLPYVSAGVALGLDADATAVVVARARVRFLRLTGADGVPADPEEHDAHLATAARLADGQLAPDAVAAAERQVAKCAVCAAVVPALREARRLLSGLAILAMADADRDALIARATAVAQRVLPSADEVAAAGDVPSGRPLSVTLVAGCLGGALLLGALAGLATGGDNGNGSAAPDFDPGNGSPTATAPSKTPSATPTPTGKPSGTPTPSATRTAGPPTTRPPATNTFSASPGSEGMALSKSAGGNGETVSVAGTGWQPGQVVTIVYLDALHRPTGQSANATPDASGAFTTSIVCYDPQNIPGPHYVSASNALGQTEEKTYTAT